MAENILAACQITGFLFLLSCALVGAYILLRWGWAGVSIIWSKRIEFDRRVEREAVGIWMGRRNSDEP